MSFSMKKVVERALPHVNAPVEGIYLKEPLRHPVMGYYSYEGYLTAAHMAGCEIFLEGEVCFVPRAMSAKDIFPTGENGTGEPEFLRQINAVLARRRGNRPSVAAYLKVTLEFDEPFKMTAVLAKTVTSTRGNPQRRVFGKSVATLLQEVPELALFVNYCHGGKWRQAEYCQKVA